jgi:hypothetical protein
MKLARRKILAPAEGAAESPACIRAVGAGTARPLAGHADALR